MLIEDELVEIKWERRNKPIFVDKGYIFTAIGDTFFVKQKELSQSSRTIVKIYCDYCGEIYEKSMVEYLKSVSRKPVLLKSACKDCQKLRIEELNIMRYGVKTNLMLESTKEKIKKTNIEKYGVENPAQNEEVKSKMKETMIERYGVEYASQNTEIRQKQKDTTFKRYGVEYSLLNKEVKEKAMHTLFTNGEAPASRAQKYIHILLGGKLNYPMGKYYIDILLDGKIAFEYDGGGHRLQVKLGNLSNEDFDEKEHLRELFLKEKGFKIIRLISNKDKLPNENILLSSINKCITYINDGGIDAEINIDNNYIKLGSKIINFDFGNLNRTDKTYFERIGLLTPTS